ncbi:hypothetical protein N7516_008723 [Penicillium verrucosum]|uniref:uncharacterized protein n=1 Tax=Penicillium verrucosum TaxID=60171 RepID=UPI0025456270|nr:uncharacterized protein N7516_008723 [Penicillium verrucosum]KAJ5926950.1 hypothetical protein N7516_008723 [Penicillium verrucosum]
MPPSTTRQLLGEGTINDLPGAGNDGNTICMGLALYGTEAATYVFSGLTMPPTNNIAWGWQYGKSCLRVQRADHATNQQHRMVSPLNT